MFLFWENSAVFNLAFFFSLQFPLLLLLSVMLNSVHLLEVFFFPFYLAIFFSFFLFFGFFLFGWVFLFFVFLVFFACCFGMDICMHAVAEVTACLSPHQKQKPSRPLWPSRWRRPPSPQRQRNQRPHLTVKPGSLVFKTLLSLLYGGLQTFSCVVSN